MEVLVRFISQKNTALWCVCRWLVSGQKISGTYKVVTHHLGVGRMIWDHHLPIETCSPRTWRYQFHSPWIRTCSIPSGNRDYLAMIWITILQYSGNKQDPAFKSIIQSFDIMRNSWTLRKSHQVDTEKWSSWGVHFHNWNNLGRRLLPISLHRWKDLQQVPIAISKFAGVCFNSPKSPDIHHCLGSEKSSKIFLHYGIRPAMSCETKLNTLLSPVSESSPGHNTNGWLDLPQIHRGRHLDPRSQNLLQQMQVPIYTLYLLTTRVHSNLGSWHYYMVVRPEKMSWLELQVKWEASIETSKSQGDVVADSPRTRKLFKQDTFFEGFDASTVEHWIHELKCSLSLSIKSIKYIYIYRVHILCTHVRTPGAND